MNESDGEVEFVQQKETNQDFKEILFGNKEHQHAGHSDEEE